MSNQQTIRPRDHLITAGKLYPNAWSLVDAMRTDKGVKLPTWPNWCFLPMSGYYSIVSQDCGQDVLPLAVMPDVARLAALGAWRVTQGVYRFDPAVYEAVKDTPLTGDIPSEVLYRLPEWCVYIETPDMSEPSLGTIYGTFAHLEYDINTGRTELRYLVDTDQELLPLIVHIGDWSLDEALARVSKEASKQAGSNFLGLHPSQLDQLKTIIEPLLSLTLYLCSENAEYAGNKPQRPKPKKTKKGWRLFPPKKPRVWDVAVRLGAAIRSYYQSEQTGQTSDRQGPRPHVRNMHWHTYWTGPKDQPEKRRAIVKWMPPIPVNVDDPGDLPTTIRPVK